MILRRALYVLATASCVAASTVPAAAASPALENRTFRLGSIYVITGRTGTWAGSHQHILGTVTLRGSWNGGPGRVIARIQAKPSTGFYRIVVRPKRRGVLRLRLGTPDGATYKVVLTVV